MLNERKRKNNSKLVSHLDCCAYIYLLTDQKHLFTQKHHCTSFECPLPHAHTLTLNTNTRFSGPYIYHQIYIIKNAYIILIGKNDRQLPPHSYTHSAKKLVTSRLPKVYIYILSIVIS